MKHHFWNSFKMILQKQSYCFAVVLQKWGILGDSRSHFSLFYTKFFVHCKQAVQNGKKKIVNISVR